MAADTTITPSPRQQVRNQDAVQINAYKNLQAASNGLQPNAAQDNQAAAHNDVPAKYQPFDSGCSLGALDLCLSDIVYLVAVALPSYFLAIANFIFSIAVNLALQSATYALTFLSQGWIITRDVANMAFLFILIYIAFQIMLRAETGGTMATLGMVIAMALVVNFSFFFTRVIIDAGNIAAVEVYNAIQEPSIAAASQKAGVNLNASAQNLQTKDLASTFMDELNVQNLLSSQPFQNWEKTLGAKGMFSSERLITLSAIYIGIGVISIILAFALLVAAVQFIGRIVLLWFAIIAAPIAFAAEALPGQRHLFRKWLVLLVRNAFYPAIFLFMFLFIVALTKAMGGSQGNIIKSMLNSVTSTAAGQTGFLYQYGLSVAVVGIELGLIVIMIKYALQFSEKFASESAGYAHKASSWAGNQYFNRVAQTAGWAGRNSIGMAGQTVSNSERLKNYAQDHAVGRMLLKTSNAAATGSYDARNSGLARQAVRSAAGVQLESPAGKGGYRADYEARTKKRVDFANTLKTSEQEKARRAKEAGATERVAEEKMHRDNERAQIVLAAEKTETLRNFQGSDNERKQILAERKQALDSAQAHRAAAEQAYKDRINYIENREESDKRIDTYADQLDKRRLGNLGVPADSDLAAAYRLRGIERVEGPSPRKASAPRTEIPRSGYIDASGAMHVTPTVGSFGILGKTEAESRREANSTLIEAAKKFEAATGNLEGAAKHMADARAGMSSIKNDAAISPAAPNWQTVAPAAAPKPENAREREVA